MATVPEWTYRHADQLRDHWWWRPGWHIGTRFYAWHITVNDQPGLHRLVDTYQDELATVAGLDLIPREWLHLTMQGVGFMEDVSGDQLAAMLASARSRLADLDRLTVTFHRPVIRPEAIALAPVPVEPVQHLRTAVRAAIADTFGAENVPEPADNYQPHISLAYVNRDQPADDVRHAIKRVDAEPVSLTMPAVSLIQMHRDHRMYEWQTIAAVPLSQPN